MTVFISSHHIRLRGLNLLYQTTNQYSTIKPKDYKKMFRIQYCVSLFIVLLVLDGERCFAFLPASSRTSFSRLAPDSPIQVSSTMPSNRLSRSITTRQYAVFGGKGEIDEISLDNSKQINKNSARTANNIVNTSGMPKLELEKEKIDLTKEEQDMAISLAGVELSLEELLLPAGISVLAVVLYGIASSAGITLGDVSSTFQAFQADPTGTLQSSLDGLGPLAVVYFGFLYIAAELLAIPATPLTLSAGYLFGVTEGAAVVLAAGTISAMIGFFIGKTFLRQWVEGVLEENPKFKKLDSAIGAEGFKLLVLIRLSPIFPFSLLNYTYGASSISFPTFVAGTLLGFAPSTLGYVYTGLVGKELLLGESSQPWYVYAGGVTLLLGLLKVVTDVATEIVEAIDDNE